MWKWQAPVSSKLPKKGARGWRTATVGVVPNPFVCGALLTALILIQSSEDILPNLSGAGTNKLQTVINNFHH